LSEVLVNSYRFAVDVDPIAKDSQAYVTTTSAEDPATLEVDITIADNPNRILIVSAGSYNPSPTIESIVFHADGGDQPLAQINTDISQSDGRCDLWYLNDPEVGTDITITVTWTGAGARRGIGAICFYNTDGINDSSKNTESSNSGTTVEGTITPTENNSAIVDGMLWLTGTSPSISLTAGFAVNISNPAGADRAVGMQYDLSPTKDSANAMQYTTSSGAGWAWCGAEIKNG